MPSAVCLGYVGTWAFTCNLSNQPLHIHSTWLWHAASLSHSLHIGTHAHPWRSFTKALLPPLFNTHVPYTQGILFFSGVSLGLPRFCPLVLASRFQACTTVYDYPFICALVSTHRQFYLVIHDLFACSHSCLATPKLCQSRSRLRKASIQQFRPGR